MYRSVPLGQERTAGAAAVSRLLAQHAPLLVVPAGRRPLAWGIPGAAGPSPARRLLVPLDGSAHAEAVLPHLPALAAALWGPDARVQVLLYRVVDTGEPDFFAGSAQALAFDPRTAVAVATHYLEGVAVRLARLMPAAQRGLIGIGIGVPAVLIPAVVEHDGVDAVAMTTHGLGGRDRPPLGSVAGETLRRVAVPLLLVPPAGLRGVWGGGHPGHPTLAPVQARAFALAA